MDKTRCPGCFRELEGAACPHCGYPDKENNAAHQLPVGSVLRGRYKIGRALGQGGFGITYLAWDSQTQQPVAVKEFFPNGTVFRRSEVSTAVICNTDDMIPHYEYSKQRFLREASALIKFKDIPEIVDILDFAEENNTSYIVMEYVRGVDMAKYIRMKGGKLSAAETFRILKPVMEALAKVHKGGIVHRDISPDNIILDPMGGAKLLDFGAVRAVEDPDVDKGLNKSTEAILKQGFAPIEQYNTRGSLGPWTDEYALCATVWYCLTGQVPDEASIRISEGVDPNWNAIPDLPPHQQKALEKGFACRAKDRYRSVDELLADLFPEVPAFIPEKAEEASAPVPGKAMGMTVSLPKKGVPVPADSVPKETEPVPAGPIPNEAGAVPARVTKAPKKRGKGIWAIAVTAVLAILLAVAFFLKEAKTEFPDPLPQEPQIHTQPAKPKETGPPTTAPLSPEEVAYLQAEALLEEGKLGEAAIAFGKLSGFSDARERSFTIWEKIAIRDTVMGSEYATAALRDDGTVAVRGLDDTGRGNTAGWTGMVAISTNRFHTVGLRADGTVMAVGDNERGQCNVDAWTDVVAISTSYYHTVGLRADGTVVATGYNDQSQCKVSTWTDVVAILAVDSKTLGLRADGTVLAAGSNDYGQCDVEDWTDVVAISAGFSHTVGLRADGTVVAVGRNDDGLCDVGNWTDVVAIAAGHDHTVGLRADGTVVATGSNFYWQCDVESWTDVVAISAGRENTIGLRADGTVIVAGSNGHGQRDVRGWTDVVAISAGNLHTVGLRADGTVLAAGDNLYGQCNVTGWTDIRLPYQRVPFR